MHRGTTWQTYQQTGQFIVRYYRWEQQSIPSRKKPNVRRLHLHQHPLIPNQPFQPLINRLFNPFIRGVDALLPHGKDWLQVRNTELLAAEGGCRQGRAGFCRFHLAIAD